MIGKNVFKIRLTENNIKVIKCNAVDEDEFISEFMDDIWVITKNHRLIALPYEEIVEFDEKDPVKMMLCFSSDLLNIGSLKGYCKVSHPDIYDDFDEIFETDKMSKDEVFERYIERFGYEDYMVFRYLTKCVHLRQTLNDLGYCFEWEINRHVK